MADVHHATRVGAISEGKASPATLAGRSHASGTPAGLSGTPGMKKLTVLVPLAFTFFESGADPILLPIAEAWGLGIGRRSLFAFLE